MPNPCCTYAQLRERAVALADSGRYDDWDEIAAAIEADDCPGATERLGGDLIMKRMLFARCQLAQSERN